jgi:hypothetical protein
MIKYQNYSNYKLPITTNPLEFGKLIEQFDNRYIIQLNTNNIVTIRKIKNENFVKFYRKGELMFEFRDTILSDNSFIRSISDQRFTFEDNKLIRTEILGHDKYIKIFEVTSLTKTTPFKNIIEILKNTVVFKNNKAELFIIFELFLVLSVFILIFIIFPADNSSLAVFSAKNIVKLRKREPIHN